MQQHADQAALSDTLIINSCAVTKEAERQVRQAIRKAYRNNPERRIVVTGCAAQIHPESFAGMKEVAAVVGNQEKLESETFQMLKVASDEALSDTPPVSLSQGSNATLLVNDIMSVRETASHMVSHFDGKARAFVQVQNGCDHRCTFCIIPYGRGNSRSVPMQSIIQQVRTLVEAGYKEIVFTGVDITSYGKDLPGEPSLGAMMRNVLNSIPELSRLRLSSIDAVEVDSALWDLIANEERFMPYLHVSLQAGDNMVLKRMKRRHTRDDALNFCKQVRALRPDVGFGADIIAGFPTETDTMFQNTLHLIEEAELHYLHVFPYSERDGTPAARMPQVPKPVRKERAAQLRKAGEKQLQQYLQSFVGTRQAVLVEKDGQGHTPQFAPCVVDSGIAAGSLVQVYVQAASNTLTGTVQ